MQSLMNTYSRSDAEVIASYLHAYGVNFHISGYCHNSLINNPVGLGGYHFSVAKHDHEYACELLSEIEDIDAPYFNRGLQNSVIRSFLILYAILIMFIIIAIALDYEKRVLKHGAYLLTPLAYPVNPQAHRTLYYKK